MYATPTSTPDAAKSPRPAEPFRAPPPRAGRRRACWNALWIAGPAAVIAVMGWRHRALTDDGTIFLRTVRQILAGNGPVVNAGERIEANTSTLWQWVLVALGAVVPGDLGRVAVLAGLVLTTAGVLIALDATRRLYRTPAPRLLLPAGILVPLAVPPFWDFATGGLDTGLGTFWLAGCWWLLVRARRGTSSAEQAAHAFWYGLGPLVRPDLVLVTFVFAGAAWFVSRPRGWALVRQVTAALALPFAYEVFRAGYYGLLVPLPALTKEAGRTEVARGVRYAWDFASPYLLYVPALLLVAALFVVLAQAPGRGWRAMVVPLTPVAASFIVTAYVVRLGGDYMHARMLLPPLFLAVMPVLLVPASRILAPVTAAVAVWAAGCAGPWHPEAYHHQDGPITVQVRESDIRITGLPNADATGKWTAAFPRLREAVEQGLATGRPVLVRLRAETGPDPLVPLNPVYGDTRISVPGGYLGVTGEIVPLDQRIVETWGLANTVGAHLDYAPDWRLRWPGHRKPLDDVWLFAQELDPAVTTPPHGSVGVTAESLAAARRALACPDLRELVESTRAPLTPGRFWRNLIGAPERTMLRIPRDPFEAERVFCGSGGATKR